MRPFLRIAILCPIRHIPRPLAGFLAAALLLTGSLSGAPEGTDADQGYLGVYMQKITKELREHHDLNVKEGVFVSHVEHESPADEAGIEEGDVIVAFDGSRIESPRELKDKVRGKVPGDRAEVSIIREGEEQNLEVVIGEQPNEDHVYRFNHGDLPGPWDVPFMPLGDPRRMILTFGPGLGVKATDLNEDLASYFKVDQDEGVLVLDVLPESAAEKAGLKAGDIITKIDGESIASVEDLKDVVSDLDSGDEFKINIVREGKKERLEAVAEFAGLLRHMGPELQYNPGLLPHLRWFPKSLDEDLDEQMEELRDQLKKLQDELDQLKEKI